MSPTPNHGELGCFTPILRRVEGQLWPENSAGYFWDVREEVKFRGLAEIRPQPSEMGFSLSYLNPELKLRVDPQMWDGKVAGRGHELLGPGCSGWVVTAVLHRLFRSEAMLGESYPSLTTALAWREPVYCNFTHCSSTRPLGWI